MFDLLKKTAAVAVITLLPAAASAAVVNMVPTFSNVGVADPTAEYNLSQIGVDNFRFGNEYFLGADAGGATFGFKFTADTLPQPTSTTFTLNLAGEFTGFGAYWSADQTIDGGDLAFPAPIVVNGLGSIAFTTTFTSVPQYLIVKYDSVKTGGDLDIRVAAVPLPAGGLLLVGALGGLAALRRRKKAA